MMRKWCVFLIILALAVPLFGQEGESNFSDIHVYISPSVGGSKEERDYFDYNLQQEIVGGGYQLTNSLYRSPGEAQEKSDFYITVELEYDEEYDERMVTLSLYNTRTGALLVTSGMTYHDLAEMDEWNLTMIYRLMANAPISKNITMEETRYYAPAPEPKLEPIPQHWLHAGFRVGYSIRRYDTPAGTDYIESYSTGNTFEAAVHAMLQPWRYLGIQTELIFTVDSAPFRGYVLRNKGTTSGTGTTSTDLFDLYDHDYSSVSLMVPLIVKGTFRFGRDRLLLAPLAGVYVVIPLGYMTVPDGDPTAYKYDPMPLGYTAGFNIGLRVGPGLLFADARYSADLGDVVRENGTPVYRRSMVSISIGYEWAFFEKKIAVKAAPY